MFFNMKCAIFCLALANLAIIFVQAGDTTKIDIIGLIDFALSEMDVDGNGNVTVNETYSLFELADLNHDGIVHRREYVIYIRHRLLQFSYRANPDDMKDLFWYFDNMRLSTPEDNQVVLTELRRAISEPVPGRGITEAGTPLHSIKGFILAALGLPSGKANVADNSGANEAANDQATPAPQSNPEPQDGADAAAEAQGSPEAAAEGTPEAQGSPVTPAEV